MLKHILLSITVLLAVMLAIGCSDSPVDNQSISDGNELDADFGSLTSTTESPAFNDPYLVSETANDVEYNDPMLGSASMDSLFEDEEAGIYTMRVVWGQLEYDSTMTSPTSWDGSLTISRGGLVLRRIIHWELNQDFILPRTERNLLEWQSTTTVHNDGIAVDFLVPPVDPVIDTTLVPEVDSLGDTTFVPVVDTTYPETDPVMVEFATGPYSRTFTLDELSKLDTIVFLEDSNAIAFHGMKLERNDTQCGKGFLAGYWGYDEEGNGIFSGMWISRFGYIDGYLQGEWGKDSNGRNVFIGKWIDRSGTCEGFVRGTYRRHSNSHANVMAHYYAGGAFYGRIYDIDKNPIGRLRGKFGYISSADGGYFQGKWKLDCFGVQNASDNWDDDYDWDGYESGD